MYWAASRYRLRRGSNPDHSFDKRFSMTTGPQLSYYYPSMIDALITNGQVIDGSGSPRFFAAVAVSGDTVTIHRDGEVPYRLIAQTMSPSGREFYPLTRSEHLDVLAFRPYTSQPNIGNVLASCMSMWNLLERSTLRPLSMSSVATLVLALSRSFRRVEITDDRTKRPTMGGSFEPPFLLPQEDRTGLTDRQSTLLRNHSGLRTSEPRRGPELASMVSNACMVFIRYLVPTDLRSEAPKTAIRSS